MKNVDFTGNALQIATYLLDSDKEQLWDLAKHREKRSLDANSYFHVLCDKLRLKLGISMARCKNQLIADYGQVMYLEDGVPLIYKTNADEDYMLELETIHTKCLKVTKENGRLVYFYRVYRGSHTYDSAEFNTLLQGCIQECQQQDIDTATPAEIARMIEMWEQKYAKSMDVGDKDAQTDESDLNTTEGQTGS